MELNFQWANLAIQLLLLIGLLWYTWETRQIKFASLEQAEAAQKPCLVPLSSQRAGEEAILEMNEAAGDMQLGIVGGLAAIRNIGSGPALNVSYQFQQLGPAVGRIPFIAAGEITPTHIARGVLSGRDFDLLVKCDSLSGRQYETHVSIRNLVIIQIAFKRVN